MKKIIKAATDLNECELLRRERIAFSVGKIGHFQRLDLHHEAKDNSNFRLYSIRCQKLKNKPIYQPTSGCAEPKNAPHLPRH